MNNQTRWIALIVLTLVSASFAKPNDQNKRNPQRTKQGVETKVDLTAQPTVAPEDDYTVDEFLLKRKDLSGKVIELKFDRVTGLKQTKNGYTAHVSYQDIKDKSGVSLLIPEEGLEHFEDYTDIRYRRNDSVYVEVLKSGVLRTVGTRYSKSKEEGERYSW